jgi:hypothetical protein
MRTPEAQKIREQLHGLINDDDKEQCAYCGILTDNPILMKSDPGYIHRLDALPEPYRAWMALNPIAPIMEAFRFAYLGAGTFSLAGLAYSAVLISITLLIGILLFNKVERTFMDTV